MGLKRYKPTTSSLRFTVLSEANKKSTMAWSEEFDHLGLVEPEAEGIVYKDKTFLPLLAVPGLSYRFDERRLALKKSQEIPFQIEVKEDGAIKVQMTGSGDADV